MIRQLKFLGGLLLASALAACGGGGGSPGTNPSQPNPSTPQAANVEVLTSTPELSTAGTSSLSFTVVAKDANNQAVPNQTVTFSASSGSLVGALPVPSTGAAGEPVTTVSLTPGSDRSNRTITVTVTAGGASRQVVIPVTGTTLTISGDTSLLVGTTSTVTVRALDSVGQPVSGATVTLASRLGNAITPTSATTNSQGNATFTYTGNSSGNDTLTASGLGATGTVNISVSQDAFRFESPAAGTVVPVATTRSVTVQLQRNGSPVAGQSVNFSTTRGTITPMTVVTDSQGRASASISSISSGPANIVAQIPTAQATLALNFQAAAASSIIIQANPGALPPNTGSSTTNQSTVAVTVRDAAGNPVAGQTVNFSLITDGSNGSINPGSAVTNANGVAQTQFIPGGLTTANNGVVIQANVAGTAISATTPLTVNTQALFISIATSNVIGQLNEQTYEKEFSVYVTDANGAPAANRVVNLEVIPTAYAKGSYSKGASGWDQTVTVTCPNEDKDRDGILDRTPVNEDTNGNGRLDPGLPVVVTPASVTTGANGFANFKLQYGENFSTWVDTLITARTTVGGTESIKQQDYFLYALLSDMTGEATPANVVSPFGTGSSCTDPN